MTIKNDMNKKPPHQNTNHSESYSNTSDNKEELIFDSSKRDNLVNLKNSQSIDDIMNSLLNLVALEEPSK